MNKSELIEKLAADLVVERGASGTVVSFRLPVAA